jgi:putative tryptophan/tyrosine transport system substrate-binding protein
MRRRVIIGGLAALLVVPEGLGAEQSSGKIPRVGILSPADSDKTAIFNAFRAVLRDLGYVEGRNIILEFRLARGDNSLLPRLAAELVDLPVDIILSGYLYRHRGRSGHVPIVNATMVDPVQGGFASSLSRPGGNITGFTLMHSELSAKRLELLRTAFPNISTVAVLVMPSSPFVKRYLQETEGAPRSLGLSIAARVEADTPEALLALTPASFSEPARWSFSQPGCSGTIVGISSHSSMRRTCPRSIPSESMQTMAA